MVQEEDLNADVIYFLGEKLGTKLNISPPAARGLLKLAMKDELGPFKLIEEIKYEDYKQIILNSLSKRLKELEIDNYEEIIQYLNVVLTKSQSLITLGRI
ncbi:MAG: hypothetical protein GF317_07405 [Candidatus Lokiarchaeota archaeon]|nr:hypothetical protein [Candidatus Lokiarchaeota archaeon]MBD3199535.1 hypothetical protein [Candidatus Lokiarchaeota archaeon]